MATRARRQAVLPGMDTPVPSARVDAETIDNGVKPFAGRGTNSYQGSSMFARDLASWRPARRSADAELLPEQGNLISRARDLDRNSGIAKGGVQTVVDNVVGVGLRLNPRPNYVALGQTKAWADEWARKVRALWWGWAETTACDAADTMIFDQMTAQVLRSQLVSGDAVTLPLWLPDRGDGWATKLQTIDPDRMSTPAGQMETLQLRSGIESDIYGAPIAYWFRLTHPGDYVYPLNVTDTFKWERVPKYTAFGRRKVIHCYDKERTGQSRGKPILSSVLSNFKGLDRFTAAEIQAAVSNSMISMTIETPLNQEGIEALFQNSRELYLQGRKDHAVGFENNSVVPLFPGDKLNTWSPTRPTSAFGMFQENVGRIIALAMDMPYELLFKDFTKANYSSMRAAMLEAWRSFNRRRDDLGTQWADPVYQLWLEEAVNAGKIDAPGFYENRAAYCRCKWIGPGRGWVDPVKEAVASETRLQARISTLEDECAEQGKDWEDVLEQIAVEQAKMRELGIPEVVIGRATVVPEDTAQEQGVGVDTPGSPATPGTPGPQQSRASRGAKLMKLAAMIDDLAETL